MKKIIISLFCFLTFNAQAGNVWVCDASTINQGGIAACVKYSCREDAGLQQSICDIACYGRCGTNGECFCNDGSR